MSDVERCVVCGVDLAPHDVGSYSLVHWEPAAGSNTLVAMYCPEHAPSVSRRFLENELRDASAFPRRGER